MKTQISLLLIAAAALSGCGAAGRLAAVGKPPKLSAEGEVVSPALEQSITSRESLRPVNTPAPQTPSASLFRTGAGSFFRDQRAARQGDILTIRINIADKAEVDNATTRSRSGGENAGIATLLGINEPNLMEANSSSTNSGAGNTSRSEQINMTVAAIVTDVLPNGNMVIRGRQEVRVNFELRELIVSGVIRPEDIARDNSIQHGQIAEARVIYGGRGQLTDAQQARWGQQIYDALFPF